MRFKTYLVKPPAFVIALLAAMVISAAGSAGEPARSLTRSEDFIQFLGEDVPSLLGEFLESRM